MSDDNWVIILIKWYTNNKRDLFWRNNQINDFQWLILEILLRRSKAEKVSDLCCLFFQKYKTPYDILEISDDELITDLRPIGYNRKRCGILKEVSRNIIDVYNGKVPNKYKELCSIKHVGSYIANAFLIFKLNQIADPCIDSNVIRIISRYYNIPVKNDNRIDTNIRDIVKSIAPIEMYKNFHYALLDLGGTICIPNNPNCIECPINYNCQYFYYLFFCD